MRIGELARLGGTTTRALRYYESLGLLTARRNSTGQREYDEDDLRLLAEIRSLTGLGFALEDTRPFVECLRDGHSSGDACPASVAVYRRKLAELEECVTRLEAARDRVRAQLEQAERRGRPCAR
ncbi:MerR family transcriptional regulator [Saccharothrix violaceirubra]|uniref:DNA-binding transcriptional MerR regulator n=1 Tax=Saccharothrix violaceirubra TaxID=413306 RepID=A0A7W7SXW4_9PSEU|nr:MerR family transcriptional regulator [Saccharothrix violaceirubra]MBB4962946.1 DNA-binding transcriptional MerR regulator [Saccharothrix violaceirubra]